MRTAPARWIGIVLVVVLAPPAGAAVFRDIVYVRGPIDERAQSLDAYTPATPGPHALVLYLAGAGQDKGATRGRHAAFNAHGMVFVSANRRDEPRAAALDDAAALLAWAQRNASRYGGDPERTFLLAAGDAAEIAVAASDDATRRATLALARGMPAGIVALAPAALPGTAGGGMAPRLLLFDVRDAAMHARVDAYVDRARGAGVAAQALPSAARDAAMLARDFGTPTDSDVAQVLAWLDSRAIARVPRFEQLVFATESLPDDTVALDGLVADGGLLLAATHGADGAARIVARAGAAWDTEAEWPGARVAVLAAEAGAVRAVLVADGVSWCTRGARDWHCAPLDGLAGAAPTHALAHEGAWHVAAGGSAFRIEQDGEDRFVARRDAPPGAADARLLACDGALHATAGGAMWRREPARWQRVAQWLGGQDAAGAARTLACVPDPAGSGRDAVLVALADGRVLRIGGAVTVEIDAAAAFRELWREPSLRVAFAPMPQAALLQADSGDVVHAFALELAHQGASRPGAYWLLRTLDGGYAYGPVRDFASPVSAPGVVAAAVQSDGAVLVATSGPALLRGALPSQGPRTGLWWDPAQSGEAMELVRDGDVWTAIVHDHDRDGTTRWTVHGGALREATFVEGGELARAGALRIAFADDAGDCRAPRALATMLRDDRTARWCLEPFVLPRRGRPTLDGSGMWRSAAPGEQWELATAAHGYDGDAAAWVMLRWVDEHARPRWLFGVSDIARGALRADLATGRCPACRDEATGALDLHFLGACGEGGGVASLEVRDGGRIALKRTAIAIEAVARKPCY